MSEIAIIDDDFDKAASYLSALSTGSYKKAIFTTLQSDYHEKENLHPLVYLFAKQRHSYSTTITEPTPAMCEGLARAIMQWSHFPGKRTVKRLFAHLEIAGIIVPLWMRDEEELRDPDHVPGENIHCRLIYRAMIHTYIQPSDAPHAPAS